MLRIISPSVPNRLLPSAEGIVRDTNVLLNRVKAAGFILKIILIPNHKGLFTQYQKSMQRILPQRVLHNFKVFYIIAININVPALLNSFSRFSLHYGNKNKNTMLCKITQHFIKTNLNMRMFGQSLYDQIHFPVMFVFFYIDMYIGSSDY